MAHAHDALRGDVPRHGIGHRARAVPAGRRPGPGHDPCRRGEPGRGDEHQLGNRVGHGRGGLRPDRPATGARRRRADARGGAIRPRLLPWLRRRRDVAAPRRGRRRRLHGDGVRHRLRPGGPRPARPRARLGHHRAVALARGRRAARHAPRGLRGLARGDRHPGEHGARRRGRRLAGGAGRGHRAGAPRVDPAEPARPPRDPDPRAPPGEHDGADVLRGDGRLPVGVPDHDLRSPDAARSPSLSRWCRWETWRATSSAAGSRTASRRGRSWSP